MKIGVSLASAILFLVMGLVISAPAEVVGHFTQVEGRVEILKGGKLPAGAAKVKEGVEPKDVVRTKSLSRAQITFLDNTTVTLSPETRFAVEEYGFDAAQGKRSAVMNLFQGLAHFVVSQVFKVKEPDFIVKTHTAVMGVRGTEVGIRLSPNDSTFLNFQGLVRVGNVFPEVGAAFRPAEKIAYSFGHAFVDLADMQGCVVPWDLPPTLPFRITPEDRALFMQQLQVGLIGRQASSDMPAPPPASQVASLPAIVSPVVMEQVQTEFNNITIPPPVPAPPSPSAKFVDLAFSQIWTGPAAISGVVQPTATFSATSPGSGTFTITGYAPGSLTVSIFPDGFTLSNFVYRATITTPFARWNRFWTGSFNTTATGTLSGAPNGPLTGIMTMTNTSSSGQTFIYQGPVTYNNGTLTYTFQYTPGTAGQASTVNIFTTNGGDPQGIVPTGTLTQVANPTIILASATSALVRLSAPTAPRPGVRLSPPTAPRLGVRLSAPTAPKTGVQSSAPAGPDTGVQLSAPLAPARVQVSPVAGVQLGQPPVMPARR